MNKRKKKMKSNKSLLSLFFHTINNKLMCRKISRNSGEKNRHTCLSTKPFFAHNFGEKILSQTIRFY